MAERVGGDPGESRTTNRVLLWKRQLLSDRQRKRTNVLQRKGLQKMGKRSIPCERG